MLLLQLVSGALVLVAARYVIEHRFDRASAELSSRLQADLLSVYPDRGSAAVADRMRIRLGMPGAEKLALLLVARDGTVLAGNLASWPPDIASNGRWRRAEVRRRNGLEPELVGLIGTRLPDGSLLLTGHVIEDEAALVALIVETLGVMLLLAAALALLGAALVARMVDRRLDTLERTSSAVALGALSERVPTCGGHDAFDRLGDSINRMLDRIEALVLELRIVTEGLAHDLRSPLTRLAAHLDDAAAAAAGADVADPVDRAAGEARLLLKMVDTTLEIGRMETGAGRDRFAPTRIDILLADLIELYGPSAEEKGFCIVGTFEDSVVMPVHRELLSRAVGNLVENALAYAHPGDLRLSLHKSEGRLEIWVQDSGPGIPEPDRELALQRYGRLDPARRRGGAGLGLALVAAVARLHGGAFRLEDAAPGVRAVIALPMADGPG